MRCEDFFIEEEFPKALKDTELIDYFEKMHNGDEKAREIIINHNIRLVLTQIFKNFYNSPYEKKELFSIGLFGLIKSVDTFDISKNIKFSTYSSICINNAIKVFIREERKKIKTQSFNTVLKYDNEGNNITIEDTLSDDNDLVLNYEKKETIQIIKDLVENLKDREREIIKLYFGFYNDQKYTQEEIGKIFNISRSNVANIIKNSLKKYLFNYNNKVLLKKN